MIMIMQGWTVNMHTHSFYTNIFPLTAGKISIIRRVTLKPNKCQIDIINEFFASLKRFF